MNTTSAGLLQRLRQPAAADEWVRFVKLCTPILFYWARRLGLSHQDAADLVQEVFTTLVQKLPAFQYDRNKGFRNWLRTVLLNRWRDGLRRKSPVNAGGAALDELPATEDPGAFAEAEYRQHLTWRGGRWS